MTLNLRTLIEYALLPAVLLVLAKLIGIWLGSVIFGIDIDNYTNTLVGSAPLLTSEDAKIITTFSDIVMFLVISTYVFLITLRTIAFHESRILPSRMRYTIERNITFLIITTYQLYHAGFVTLIFMWLATTVIFYNAISGVTDLWLFFVCLMTSFGLSYFLVRDVYNELKSVEGG